MADRSSAKAGARSGARPGGDPTTADARLRRILHVLPAARRDGGVDLETVARELEVEPATIHRDLEEVTARSLYLPAGPADDLQIQLTPDRIRVWTKGKFARPVKLLAGEALALGLGLRAMAAAAVRSDAVESLRARLEQHLATTSTEELQPLFEPAGDEEAGGATSSDPDVTRTVFAAARERRPCRIRYLKPGAHEPEARTLHPWVVARAEGRWYAVGRDPGRDDDRTRVFRIDRILEAEPGDGAFEVPDDFDVSQHLDRGRLFDPEDFTEVTVRYSPGIARWIREKPWADGEGGSGRIERRDDGSLVVRHRVADPRWIVRHVLQYGPDAEVLEPEGIRERMRSAAARMAG